VIVATGNHFFFDAATGALVVVASAAIALPLTRARPPAEILTLAPPRALDSGTTLERAA
jgi:hypothetical protein